MAKKNIHAYPWGKVSFDMLMSSVKSFTTEKFQKIDNYLFWFVPVTRESEL